MSDSDEPPGLVNGEIEASVVNKCDVPRKRPVPATVITGALGAGKTTLIRQILHQPHGFRIAVVLNEVGEEQGLEQSMVLPTQGSVKGGAPTWVELSNGCLCCSVKSEFLLALEALLQSSHTYDYVLIEATGLADPGPVAASLWTDGPLESEVCLDAIVTLVDAKNLPRQLQAQREPGSVNEVERQIAYADLILLNKVDLAEADAPGAVQKVENSIRGINAAAVMHHTNFSNIDPGLILDQHQYDMEGASTQLLVKVCKAAQEPGPDHVQHARHHHLHHHDGEHNICSSCHDPETLDSVHDLPQHSHDGSVQTINLVCTGRLNEDRFRRFVEDLLWDAQPDGWTVYRIKGLITLATQQAEEAKRRHMLQGVYELYDLYPGPTWQEGEDSRNRLLLVGKGLQRQLLQQRLEQCIV